MTSKRTGRCAAIAALVLAAFFPGTLAAQQVTLLHVNDTHSHLDAWGPKDSGLNGTLGGLAKVATIVKAERDVDPQVLFVHAGDFMDGDFFFNEHLGIAELRLLKSIGLDALVLGNHEFGFGPTFLYSVLNRAWPGASGAVPIVGTNLDLTPAGCPALGPWLPKLHAKVVNGVIVGFFGLTTPKALFAGPAPCKIDAGLTQAASEAVATLRAAPYNAQLVVGLSHAGMAKAREVAAAVPGIDVIVNGHDNALLEQPEVVANTLIVSAGNHYGWVGRLRLSVGSTAVAVDDYTLIPVDASVPPDSTTEGAVAMLKAAIVARYGDVYHHPLAWAEDVIAAQWDPRHAKRDTPLGNLVTDAYRAWTGTDIAVEAMGFLGDPIPAGWVVGADAFRAMSFGLPYTVPGSPPSTIVRPYRLVTFKATGSEILKLLNTTISLGGDYFPQVSGLRLSYDATLAGGKPVLRDTVHVGGRKLVDDALYSVTVAEGVNSALPKLGIVVFDTVKLPDLAFDATRAWIELQGELGAASSNRLRDVAGLGNGGKDN